MVKKTSQNIIPSFQVHINPKNNGTQLVQQVKIPNNFTRYASVVNATIPVTWYNIENAYILVGCATITRLRGYAYKCNFQYESNGYKVIRFDIPDGQYSVSDICDSCVYDDDIFNFKLRFDHLTNRFAFIMYRKLGTYWFNEWGEPFQVGNDISLISTPFLTQLGFNPNSDTAITAQFGHFRMDRHYWPWETPEFIPDGTFITWQTQDYDAPNVFYLNLGQIVQASDESDLALVKNINIVPNFATVSYATSSVLARIPVDVGFGSLICYNNEFNFKAKTYSDDIIDTILLNFIDASTGKDVNLDGCNWNVTIQFDFYLNKGQGHNSQNNKN